MVVTNLKNWKKNRRFNQQLLISCVSLTNPLHLYSNDFYWHVLIASFNPLHPLLMENLTKNYFESNVFCFYKIECTSQQWEWIWQAQNKSVGACMKRREVLDLKQARSIIENKLQRHAQEGWKWLNLTLLTM